MFPNNPKRGKDVSMMFSKKRYKAILFDDCFDINNTSEKLETLYDAVKTQIDNGSVVFFEGGSKERDTYGHDGGGMYDIKDKIGYKILTGNVKYSASAIYNSKMFDLDFS